MQKLEKEKLNEVYGGGFSFGFAALIGAGITFIIGIVDGYIRPLACR